MTYGSGRLDLPHDVDALRSRDVDAVAVLELEALGQLAALKLADADAKRASAARFDLRQKRLDTRRSGDEHVAGRRRRRRPGGCEHLQNRHVPGERVLAGHANLAKHEHVLAAVLRHLDGDLRRHVVAAVDELLLDERLHRAKRQPGRFHAADVGIVERAVGIDGHDPREIGLAQQRDAEDVLEADDVVRLTLRRAGRVDR